MWAPTLDSVHCGRRNDRGEDIGDWMRTSHLQDHLVGAFIPASQCGYFNVFG